MNRKIPILFLFLLACLFSQAQNLKLGLPISHIDEVVSSRFSEDGRFLLTASRDKTAQLIDVQEGVLIHSFEGHFDELVEARFIHQEEKILTASKDGTAMLYDKESAKLLQMYDLDRPIERIALSPDENYLLLIPEMGLPRFFEVNTGRLIYVFKKKLTKQNPEENWTYDTFLSNSVYMVETDYDHLVYDVVKRKRLSDKVLDSIRHWKWFSLAIENNQLLVLDSAKLKRYDLKTMKLVSQQDTIYDTLELANSKLFGFSQHVRGRLHRLVNPENEGSNSRLTVRNNSYDKSVLEIYDEQNKLLKHKLGGRNKEIYSLSYCGAENYMLVGNKNEAKYLDLTSGESIPLYESYEGGHISVKHSPNGEFIVAWENSLMLWSKSYGNLGRVASFEVKPAEQSVYFSKDNNWLFWQDRRGLNKLDLKEIALDLPSDYNEETDKLFFDDRYMEHDLIRANGDTLYLRFNYPDYERVTNVTGNKMVFSSNEELCAIYTRNVVNLYDVKNDSLIATIENLPEKFPEEILSIFEGCNNWPEINSCSFSADSKELIISSGAVSIHSTKTGEMLKFYERSINARPTLDGEMLEQNIGASFDPSQTYLIASGNGTTVYKANRGDIRYKFNTNRYFDFDAPNLYSQLWSLSPDVKRIIVASSSNEARVFDLKTGKVVYNFKDHKNTITKAFFTNDGKYIVTASLDGSFILYDPTSGKQVLRYFEFEGKEDLWVYLHPDGFFDASAEAMELMYWTKGLDVIDFTQLKNRYWQPNLLQTIMEGKALPDVKGLNELHLQPEVRLGQVENNMLPINLIKRDGGYGEVTVLINGKEVSNDIRGSRLDTSALSQVLNLSLANQPYLKSGTNIIEIRASSEDGFIQGKGVSITYVVDEEETVLPSFYGVVIGVGDYANPFINLKFPPNDAEAVTKALKLGAENLFGERTYIHTLSSSGEKIPNKQNIKDVFEEIGKTAKPEDVIFIYLSGHGLSWGGNDGDFYFLTSDAKSADKDFYEDDVLLGSHAVSTQEFITYLKNINALKQVMIIDACGSGKAIDKMLASRDIAASQLKAFDRMKDRMGMFILSGCAADEVSYETSKYGQGLLTYSVLEAMRGGVTFNQNRVDVDKVVNYARERVPVLASGIGGIQEPQLLVPTGGSFDIGILSSTDKQNIPLATPQTVFVQSMFMNKDSLMDALQLAKAVDLLLEQEGDNEGVNIEFIKSAEYPNSCKISGLYRTYEGKIQAEFRIVCGNDLGKVHLIEVESKDELLLKVKELILEVSDQN